MQLDAYRKFELELDRIEMLYHATIYSYKATIDSIDAGHCKKDCDSSKRILIHENKERDLLVSRKALKSKFEKKLPNEISQLIFVRAISVLEVFMISQVRELFLARRDLFHSKEKVDFARGELLNAKTITELWVKVINRELRKLQNQSLSDKSKYYSKYLNVNFSESSEYPLPQERIHDMRHLIVHRLGKTDEVFRKKYKTDLNSITITEDELRKSISSIRAFGRYIFDNVSPLIDGGTSNNSAFHAAANVVILRDKVVDVFTQNYKFIDGESLIWCSDFIRKITTISECEIKIEMQGDKNLILSYFRLLNKLRNGRSISIIELEPNNLLNDSGSSGRKLNDDEIIEVAKGLPVRPWKKDIHKRIAKTLGTSNNVVSEAIRKILEQEDLEVLIGTDKKYS